ncbi:MAG: DUF493 domain-containing protein [Bacteroidetes bacterium SW_11_45_7]|jgi:putative lipoic acid-binding regulatory protein|nr:MAG: DUF493 domain-containing protein [Bacteroidetes bacterium SW_11_45_7]
MDETYFQRLKDKLDRQEWPAVYMFKFLAPIEKLPEIRGLFDKEESKTTVSKKGNYISVTFTPMMYNSEKVIETYRQASRIKGVMSL